MPALSGLERFVNLIGGPQNLPPPKGADPQPDQQQKSQQQQPVEASTEDDDNWPWTLEQINVMNKKYKEDFYAKRRVPKTVHAGPTDGDVNVQPQFTPNVEYREPTEDDLKFDPRMGEPAPRGFCFSPFLAITKFCYKYVRWELRQPLATAFFDANKIYMRPWDQYFIWSPHYETNKPITVVPEHQLQQLLDDINLAFPDAKLSITDELRSEGLALNFDALPDRLRPRWLGQTSSREQWDHWVAHLPMPESLNGPVPSDRSLEAFKEHMEKIMQADKTKKSSKKQATQQVAIARKQEQGKQVLRGQRYLGLLQKNDENALIPDLGDLSISALDPDKPAPYSFEMDAIFISIDCEAHERPPNPVTEVGVATLDTRDLRGIAPGLKGQGWKDCIRGRHFRVIENKHLINKDFVTGCPDKFDFGKSEFVSKDRLASVVTSCFHHPFSSKVVGEEEKPEEKRNIILLGHDVMQDVAYLHSIGMAVKNRASIFEVMDTAAMFRSYTRDVNPTSLGRILYHFELAGWNLHNAGNDAVYTLWALLAICVQAATERGNEDAEKRHADNLVKRTEDAVESAREKTKNDAEGWLGQDATEDGGYAVAPTDESGSNRQKGRRPAFGPVRPPHSDTGLWTSGGVPLDV